LERLGSPTGERALGKKLGKNPETQEKAREEMRRKKSLERFIISRSSTFFQLWNLLNTVTCIVSSFQYAFMTAFGSPAEHSAAAVFDTLFEAVFISDAILQFFVEYYDPDTRKPVRDPFKIAKYYFKGRFPFDCLTIIPFTTLFHQVELARLFYIVKVLRLSKGYYLLDLRKFKQSVKAFFDARLQAYIKRLDEDHDLQENMYLDHTMINMQMSIIQTFKTFKLIIFILGSSYFIGMFWYIVCDLNNIQRRRYEARGDAGAQGSPKYEDADFLSTF
jgi:hypothetical protein